MDKQQKRLTAKRFFFPFAPFKMFSSIKLMAVLAALIALRIILNFISVRLPCVGVSISFAWIPTMLLGWVFGPVHGFVWGFVLDTICYAITPSSVWYWMYAIQEPIVGFLAGIAASVCALRMNRKKANPMYDILVQQFMLLAFVVTSLFSIFLWTDTSKQSVKNLDTYKIITCVMLAAYIIIMECFTFIQIKGFERHKQKTLTFIYATMLVTIVTLIFSFALGPISAVQYLNYVNGVYPDNYLTYGIVFYLVPRVIVESIKTPLEALAMFGLIMATQPILRSINNAIKNKW